MKFFLDDMLHKAAKWLRFMGMDVTVINSYKNLPSYIDGVFITLSIGHYLKGPFENKYFLLEKDYINQINIIKLKFNLEDKMKPFSRCGLCNTTLTKIDKKKIYSKLPPKAAENFDVFYICENCNKIYWQGTHCKKIDEIIKMDGK